MNGQIRILGRSANHLPILGYEFGTAGPRLWHIAGIHGNEWEGVRALRQELITFLEQGFPYRCRLLIVPEWNPDGVLAGSRLNGNGVDLNRNLPTQDWNPKAFTTRYPPGPYALSEPENQALVAELARDRPKFILSAHSWHPLINTNGDCAPESTILHARTGYRIDPSIGYPTPGCLGTFTGLERKIPTITLEIQRNAPLETIDTKIVPALVETLTASAQRS
jgi:protein MpaA